MPQDRTIMPGDCTASLAYENGLFPDTVWNHPKNSELKSKRKHPHLLKQGDVLHIPDRRLKEVSQASDAKYKFKRKGVPAKLRLRLMEEVPSKVSSSKSAPASESKSLHLKLEEKSDPPAFEVRPRAKVRYVLKVEGMLLDGTTDADGILEQTIPPDARSGEIIIDPGTEREIVVPIRLGHLEPLDEISGVKQRLANLSFDCGDRADLETAEFAAALAAFQEWTRLPVTWKLDQPTKDKLKESHGA